MFLGGKPATAPYVVASQFFTFSYFAYFFFLVPLIPAIERFVIADYQTQFVDSETSEMVSNTHFLPHN